MSGEGVRYDPQMVPSVETPRAHTFLPPWFSRKARACDEMGQYCKMGPRQLLLIRTLSLRGRINSFVRRRAGLDLNSAMGQMALVHLP